MTSETIARIAFALACNYRVYVKLRPDMGQENRDREQGYHDVRFWVPRASAHPFNGLGAFYSANDRGWPEAWEYDRSAHYSFNMTWNYIGPVNRTSHEWFIMRQES